LEKKTLQNSLKMKLSIISAIVATLLATSSAAPVEAPRQFQVAITFNAAAGVTYFQYIPADGEDHDIDSDLSFSSITSAGGAECTFYGIDGSVTEVDGAETVDIGPPQTQVSGTCEPL
jgi:hypothetical protein